MKSLGQEETLIRFTSQRELEGLAVDKGLRLRPFFYLAAFVVVLSFFGLMLARRGSAEITVLRQAGALYGEIAGGKTANYFSIRIVNRGLHAEQYKIKAVEGVQFVCSICEGDIEADSDRRGSLIVIFDSSVKERDLTIQINQETLPIKLLSPKGT
jgi:polyferredoxin